VVRGRPRVSRAGRSSARLSGVQRSPGHAPSVKRARPPVGWHSTALQLPQSTTVWLWLNTVVIVKHPWWWEGRTEREHGATTACAAALSSRSSASSLTKQVRTWHLTSMKKLFGDCTSLFSLCFRFSNSAGGFSRSKSAASTWTQAAGRAGSDAAQAAAAGRAETWTPQFGTTRQLSQHAGRRTILC